jgi:ATP-binding cassette subfamily C protein EexD
MSEPVSSADELVLLFRRFRSSFVYVGVFSLFINLLMLIPSLYMLQVYDRVMVSRSGETLLMLTLITTWMFGTMALLDLVRSRLLVRWGTRFDDYLNSRLYSVILAAAVKYPGNGTAQPLVDLSTIRQFLTGNGPFAFFDTPWIPIYLILLFLFHPWTGWFAIFAALTLIAVAIANEVKTRDLLKSANAKYTQSTAMVGAHLRNAEVLYAMGMETALRKQWLNTHIEYLKEQSDASDKAGFWANLSKMLRMLFQSLILGLGAYLAINNEISSGTLIAGSILMGRALAPIDQLVATWRQFSGARQAYQRLQALLREFPAQEKRLSLPPPNGAIHFETVTVFAPRSQRAVLRAINFSLPAGETLVVLGASAAGKSSMLRALVGVWPVVAGAVRIDGADIRHWNRDELGVYVGYLPQDVELFDGTVAQNIARFEGNDAEKIHAAARMAGVDELIRHLPDGYETRIGPGGTALSGGQRQRIGLARALYGDPRLVVLDEPNANLDEAGEHALLRACQLLQQKGATLVLVTHRTNIVSIAHKLMLLRDGQISLYGGRDAVLQQLTQNQSKAPTIPFAQGGAAKHA